MASLRVPEPTSPATITSPASLPTTLRAQPTKPCHPSVHTTVSHGLPLQPVPTSVAGRCVSCSYLRVLRNHLTASQK